MLKYTTNSDSFLKSRSDFVSQAMLSQSDLPFAQNSNSEEGFGKSLTHSRSDFVSLIDIEGESILSREAHVLCASNSLSSVGESSNTHHMFNDSNSNLSVGEATYTRDHARNSHSSEGFDESRNTHHMAYGSNSNSSEVSGKPPNNRYLVRDYTQYMPSLNTFNEV
jgi:hypothetical protein